jgi:hypothetical protein
MDTVETTMHVLLIVFTKTYWCAAGSIVEVGMMACVSSYSPTFPA